MISQYWISQWLGAVMFSINETGTNNSNIWRNDFATMQCYMWFHPYPFLGTYMTWLWFVYMETETERFTCILNLIININTPPSKLLLKYRSSCRFTHILSCSFIWYKWCWLFIIKSYGPRWCCKLIVKHAKNLQRRLLCSVFTTTILLTYLIFILQLFLI